jgi:glycine cleavage system aminomethyltransferase T
VGYPLYGNDLDREHTALESGLGWIVKLDRDSTSSDARRWPGRRRRA